MKWKVLPACVLIAAIATVTVPALGMTEPAASVPPKEEADGIIFERQNLMLQISKDSELLGEIAAGIKPPDKLAEVTKSISESAEAAKAAFQPNVPGGRSKPEVWSNWSDYSRRMDEFSANAKHLAELGAKGDLSGVTNALGTALPRKECHDVYRGPKK